MKFLRSTAIAAALMLGLSQVTMAEEGATPASYKSDLDAFNSLTAPAKPKSMSPALPRSAWLCYTPYGTCFVPYLGGCCCWYNGICWSGSTG